MLSYLYEKSTLNLCGINEATNPLGPNRCTSSSQCDGARTCSQWGWCEGVSGCGSNDSQLNLCGINEATNPLGPNRCTSNSQCDGARTCSQYNWCEGVSGCGANDSQTTTKITTPTTIQQVVTEPGPVLVMPKTTMIDEQPLDSGVTDVVPSLPLMIMLN